jgi:hypothetical protein
MKRYRMNPVDRERRPSQMQALCKEFPSLDRWTVVAIMRRHPGANDQELRRQIRRWLRRWEARQ